jgi:predicted dehydrogenase
MTRTIGWAILGTGGMARQFAAALKSSPSSRLAAVRSREADRAEAFAKAAGDSATRGFTGLGALLAEPSVEIVYIATPNHLHAQEAIACMEAGKAVLIEKPIATSLDDARAIAEASARTGRFCMEAMWTLCLPALIRARALIDEGRIGAIRHIGGGVSYARPPGAGGGGALLDGALLDLGVYPLSIAQALLGPPPEAKATMRRGSDGQDIAATMALGWEGASASLHCGHDAEGPNELTITGEHGVIRLSAPMISPALVTLTPKSRPAGQGPDEGPVIAAGTSNRQAWKQMLRPLKPGRTKLLPAPYRGNGLIHEIEEAQECLRAGRRQSDLVPLALSLGVQETMERMKG